MSTPSALSSAKGNSLFYTAYIVYFYFDKLKAQCTYITEIENVCTDFFILYIYIDKLFEISSSYSLYL